jgi:hypothetical protein
MLINQYLKYQHIENGISLNLEEDAIFLMKNEKSVAIFTLQTTPENILIEVDKILIGGLNKNEAT